MVQVNSTECNPDPLYLNEDRFFIGPEESQSAMSGRSYANLAESVAKTKANLKEAGEYAGSAGEGNDWHDNFALEDAKRQVDILNRFLIEHKTALEDAVIIRPAEFTDRVGMGSLVTLQFSDGLVEEYHVLGEVDVLFNSTGVLSWKSPIGRKILGKPIGSIIEIEVDKGFKFKVQISQINSGRF